MLVVCLLSLIVTLSHCNCETVKIHMCVCVCLSGVVAGHDSVTWEATVTVLLADIFFIIIVSVLLQVAITVLES